MKISRILALALMPLAGCAASGTAKSEADCKPTQAVNRPGAGAVNTVCPIINHEADQTVTLAYEGKTIAFCCEECVDKFIKMGAADKKAVLAKATAYGK